MLHRVIVNTFSGEFTPDTTEAIDVDGRLYARQYDGALRPIDACGSIKVGEYVSSGWHDCPADAYREVAGHLARRAQELVDIRAVCLAKSEVAIHA